MLRGQVPESRSYIVGVSCISMLSLHIARAMLLVAFEADYREDTGTLILALSRVTIFTLGSQQLCEAVMFAVRVVYGRSNGARRPNRINPHMVFRRHSQSPVGYTCETYGSEVVPPDE